MQHETHQFYVEPREVRKNLLRTTTYDVLARDTELFGTEPLYSNPTELKADMMALHFEMAYQAGMRAAIQAMREKVSA